MATQVSYQFTHEALTAADHVQVVRFEGREGISQLFEFTIELLCSNADLDQDDMLDKDATFSFAMGDDKRVVQGILSEFDAIKQVNNQVLYQAVLVPRLWQLSLYKTNEVYLDMTTPEMIKAVLAEGGLSDIDYDFSRVDEGNTKKYRKWPFKLQYAESHLDFMSRMMERDGIYYFFEATENGEKIIFCDDLNHHSGIENSTIKYLPASSLEINQAANTVSNFIAQRQRLPNKVLLRDYNDNTPSLDIKGEYEVDPRGKGEVYVWGLNIENSDEGLHLAKVSAERLIAKHHTYSGESTICRLVPGFLASLEGHFRAKCNIEYQVVSIEHQGINPEIVQEATKQQAYENQFIAISSDTQFRAELLTARPEIHGNLNAFVDASGDGHYAEVDKEGRYRITLPFDRVDREGKKASHYIRMSQPFSGENQGMHFPLRKGAEVLLSFIGGDPDRPVISGSIPNASQPSVVNEENQTNSLIKTGAGNKIELEDKDGQNRIKFETPQMGTYMHLGAPNHPGDGVVVASAGIDKREFTGGQQLTFMTKLTASEFNDDIQASQSAIDKKNEEVNDAQAQVNTDKANVKNKEQDVQAAERALDTAKRALSNSSRYNRAEARSEVREKEQALSNAKTALSDAKDKLKKSEDELAGRQREQKTKQVGKARTESRKERREDQNKALVSGEKDNSIDEKKLYPFKKIEGFDLEMKEGAELSTEDELGHKVFVSRRVGDRYIWADQRVFEYGNTEQFNFGNSHVINNALIESDTAKHAYTTSDPAAYSTSLYETMLNYQLKNTKPYSDGDGVFTPNGTWDQIIALGDLEINQTDSFRAHNGNIYDFGGYWDYNLGNGYTENHIDQNGVELNIKHDHEYQGDVIAGPNSGDIATSHGHVKLHTDSTGVEKSFGDSYEYSEGNALEISHGNSESHSSGDSYDYSYGGRSEEYSYHSNGKLMSKSTSGDGVESEWNYDASSGVLNSYETSNKIAGIDTFSFTATAESSASFSFGASTSFSASMSSSLDLSLYASACMDMSFGVKPFEGEIDLSATALNLKLTNDEFETNLPKLKVKADLRAAEIKKKAKAELHAEVMSLLKSKMEIQSKALEVGSSKMRLANSMLTLFS